MAETLTPLEADKYYHIFNHAVGTENLFDGNTDYICFLDKFKKYVNPFCEALAYCLLPNHFHFVICVKNKKSIMDYVTKNKSRANVSVSDVLSKSFSDFLIPTPSGIILLKREKELCLYVHSEENK